MLYQCFLAAGLVVSQKKSETLQCVLELIFYIIYNSEFFGQSIDIIFTQNVDDQ